ncbi:MULTISPECIES: hypothetical protein [unclassified Spirosoma]|uniref:hypothetical protein n=1 Tax=unclassified Spirosoma TaxID=2621999 RepID=UPI000A9203DE|nr:MULTISPECIES: hypothetical protein [unclassified Spirosoma]MBN8820496.1 hypothetical protein [Spirosoma sp.]
MPTPIEIQDVAVITGSLKAHLLKDFQTTLLDTPLYKKVGRRYQQVPDSGDTLRNKGYFIKKATLTDLLNRISEDEGGVWINFALGHNNSVNRGLEIQLVITAVDSQDRIVNSNAGTYCVTTSDSGDPTDPPHTGITG